MRGIPVTSSSEPPCQCAELQSAIVDKSVHGDIIFSENVSVKHFTLVPCCC